MAMKDNTVGVFDLMKETLVGFLSVQDALYLCIC